MSLRQQHAGQERHRGAMYLAGYSIECKLKVRLMEQFGVWNLRELESELSRRLGATDTS